ncbi:hypothetical protein, partial [Stenotrophomonas maltophilia]|uniref:hypothetical protein n=1 Tax=Stenotrophomonas maltophilia TaxID=40324 RepID=UPI0019558686
PARHSRQTDCQPAPRAVVPAGKRKLLPNKTGFRVPTTDARWRSNDYLLLFGMPTGRVNAAKTRDAFGIVA